MSIQGNPKLEDLDLFGVGHFARAATQPIHNATDSVQWALKKNCSLTPRQLAACLACVSLPGFLAGLAFFVLGAPMILLMLVLQGITMAWCFAAYGRHAADREWLRVSQEAIEVHIVHGADEVRNTFNRSAASLALLAGQQNLIAISESGRSVQVGSSLPMHLRPVLFEDLCLAACRFQ